jgi:hypothetical protein
MSWADVPLGGLSHLLCLLQESNEYVKKKKNSVTGMQKGSFFLAFLSTNRLLRFAGTSIGRVLPGFWQLPQPRAQLPPYAQALGGSLQSLLFRAARSAENFGPVAENNIPQAGQTRETVNGAAGKLGDTGLAIFGAACSCLPRRKTITQAKLSLVTAA